MSNRSVIFKFHESEKRFVSGPGIGHDSMQLAHQQFGREGLSQISLGAEFVAALPGGFVIQGGDDHDRGSLGATNPAQAAMQARARLTETLGRLVQLYEVMGQKYRADVWRKQLQEHRQGASKAKSSRTSSTPLETAGKNLWCFFGPFRA
jgi:hypothetical protein